MQMGGVGTNPQLVDCPIRIAFRTWPDPQLELRAADGVVEALAAHAPVESELRWVGGLRQANRHLGLGGSQGTWKLPAN